MAPRNRLVENAGLRPAGGQDAGAPSSGVRSAGILPASTGAAGDVGWRSRGYIPHIDKPHLVQHVIIRLADSLPIEARKGLDEARPTDRVAIVDAALDRGNGMRELGNAPIAELVQSALLTFDGERYSLLAWCVMPNHVHGLVEVRTPYRLDRTVHSWKSYTGLAANRLLGRTGAFWAREYFDRFVRDDEHLARTAAYIEGNPVRAGLCENVSDWRFSSAWRGWAAPAGLRPACRRSERLAAMELFLQQVMAGLASGAIYACMALAVVMIYQAIDHLNFAQGEMAMFSTFIAWQLLQWGVPYWGAFVLVVLVSFVGGVLIERVLFRPIHHAPVLAQLVAFIALFSVLNSSAGEIWNFTIKEFPTPFGRGPFLGTNLISTHDAGMIAVTAVILALLYLFFRGSRLGLAMRAAAANPESARLVGIRVGWMIALGWGMSAAIGAVAGMLIAPVVYLEPNMMGGVLLYGFAGAVLGGMTSPGGAVLGGFAVGVIENLAGAFIPYFGRELKLTIALMVIVAVLLIRPSGIFGRPVVSRV